MASPNLSKAIADFDPLNTPVTRMPDEPSTPSGSGSNSNNPLSFKRRSASKSTGFRSGLLGGLLKPTGGDDDEDLVPPPPSSGMKRADAPKRIDLPPSSFQRTGQRVTSQALTDSEDDEENEDGLEDGQRTPTSLAPPRWQSSPAGRISFGNQQPLRSPRERWDDDGRAKTGMLSPGGRTDITSGPAAVTPLPILSITVLCLALFGEFSCASTSSPFLYFMIEDFGVGQGPGGGGEAAVGFWTGIVGSVFFLSQFLTSLLWVSVADKHGRRAVLFASLLGNGLSLMAFGTAKNLPTAICIRLTMGLFNGAVGVARSAVIDITDSTNESAAFTLMGLAWGLGGIVGSVVGGLAENPVRNHPYFFGNSRLFAEYPYLLPCLISGSVTLLGAFLSIFLGPNGGPREGGIRLPTDKEVKSAATSIFHLPGKIISFLLSFFRSQQSQPIQLDQDDVAAVRRASQNVPSNYRGFDNDRTSIASGITKPTPYGTAFASAFNPNGTRRTSRMMSGSAYGYERPRRYTGLSQNRRMSAGTSTRYAPDYEDIETRDLNFAQRLLLANEPAIFSLSDLWVANATRNDDAASTVDYGGSVFDHDDDDDEESRIGVDDDGEEPDFFGYGTAPPSVEDLRGAAQLQDEDRSRRESSPAPSRAPSLYVPRGARGEIRSPSQEGRQDRAVSGKYRRGSVASSMRGPTIFANTGLRPSSLGALASPSEEPRNQPIFPSAYRSSGADTPGESSFNPMAAIPEGARAPSIVENPSPGLEVEDKEEKAAESIVWQLPLAMIAQYSLLALHGTTCDQVFMSFIVTPVPSGGLGLKAANYAVLVALMFFFQTLWQFRFYPFVVAPRGFLSHLAMFRLGLFLYIPVYLLFPELRGLLRANGNNTWVMFGMTVLSSIRYLGNTCAYTAVMVLINAMSPPHLVPFANGLAQSAVSLARFIGPILGGTLWALSIQDGPSAHQYPFNYAAGFVVIAMLCGLGFLHSFRIH